MDPRTAGARSAAVPNMDTTDATGEERRVSDESHDRRDRMTVSEAARVLGISEGAVRKRVERGKLQAEHTPDGRLVVYLDTSATARDHVRDESYDNVTTEQYIRSLEDQVGYLRQQLDAEREARTEERRRHDTILAQLTSRIPELEPARDPIPPPQPPEAPETDVDAQQGRGPVPDTEAPQEPSEAEPRSWWRRMFGS